MDNEPFVIILVLFSWYQLLSKNLANGTDVNEDDEKEEEETDISDDEGNGKNVCIILCLHWLHYYLSMEV